MIVGFGDVLDFIIANIETSLSVRKRQALKYRKTRLTFIILVLFLIVYFVIKLVIAPTFYDKKDTVVIATKNFSEQFILGDIMADMIAAKTHLHVEKKFNLGTTTVVQNALLKGDVDLYPEYTGTAYMIVLKHTQIVSAEQTYQIVKQEYKKRFHLIWLKPFGFNNAETLAVTQAFALNHHLETLSDLAKISARLTIGATPEFLKRPDGLPGLTKAYGFKFKRVLQLEPDLAYEAIANKDVDVIEAFTTDGRIFSFHLRSLKDNKHFSPPPITQHR